MHTYYPSPILWGFITTKNSQSDSCLLVKDCVKTLDTENDTHTSKSVHDVTSGSTLDSMSWLSKLIKAKSDTVVKTVNAQDQREPVAISENETNERAVDRKVDKSIIIIPRRETSYLSIPITKKRTRPTTPEHEIVDAESEKLKLGVVGVHEKDSKQRQQEKYLGLTFAYNTSGNAKRKFEGCDDNEDDESVSKRVYINRKPARAPGRILDPWPCLYGKPTSDPSEDIPTASCSNVKPDDVDADAESAMYMGNGGPATVKEYRSLQDKHMPVIHASYYAEQRPADVSVPGFHTVDSYGRQCGPQLKIYGEPSKKEPRILDPWPCLYGNKKSDPSKPTTSSYEKPKTDPKPADVSETGFHTIDGTFYLYGPPPEVYGEPSKKEPRILDPWPCLYGNKKSEPPKPTTSSYAKPEAYTKPADEAKPGFCTVDGTFYQYGPPPTIYGELSKKEPRILDPWPCLYGKKKSDPPKPTTSSYEKPETNQKPADVSEPRFHTVDGTFYDSPPTIQREPSKKAIRILEPWPCLYGNIKTSPPKENLTGPSTQQDDNLDAEVAMYMENGGPPTVLGYRLMPHKYIPRLRESNRTEQKPADPRPQAAYHVQQKQEDPRLLAAYHVHKKPADSRIQASYSGAQQKPVDPRLEAAYHVQQKPADPINQATYNAVQEPADPRLQAAYYAEQKPADRPLQAAYRVQQKPAVPIIQATYNDRRLQAAYHVQQKPADPRIQASCSGAQKPADVALPGYYSADGCYHQFQSPRMINRKPNKEAIRLLKPWPCLYRNTKFGELKIVGTLNVQDAPQHWKRFPAKTCEQNLY